MYLKKLKLQNKLLLAAKTLRNVRGLKSQDKTGEAVLSKINSIFISVCTVLYLAVPSSLYKAEGSGSFNIRQVDSYYYGVLSYSLENTPPNYMKIGTGTSPIASPTTPNYYWHYRFAFNNFGCYNGRLQLTFNRGSFGVNDSIIVEGAVLYSSSNDTSGAYITIEFNGNKYATMDIYIKTVVSGLSYSSCTALGTWTEHGNSVAENVENAYNQIVTLNTYVNQINSKLAQSNNHLFDIVSNTTTLVTNTNNIKTNTDNIKDKLDTLHTDNQDIITAINNVNATTQTDNTTINNFDTDLDIINNIESPLLNRFNNNKNDFITLIQSYGDTQTGIFVESGTVRNVLWNILPTNLKTPIITFINIGLCILLRGVLLA